MTRLIRSFNDLSFLTKGQKVFCLDSGGLDSAYLICRLVSQFDVEVHTLTVNVGQVDSQPVELPTIIQDRLVRHYVDAREEFASEYVLPLLQSCGIYLDQHPLSASLTRPLIAKHLVLLAREHQISTILHSATPSQNSMRRFNCAIKDLHFNGYAGSPYLNDNISRSLKAAFIAELGGQVAEKRNFSIDTNLFCREFESGELNNPENISIDESMYLWTHVKPQENLKIKITLSAGIPTHINDKQYHLSEIITKLNTELGSFGIGRYAGLEEGPRGIKVLEVRESPAATVLLKAFSDLSNANYDYSSLVKKKYLDQLWTWEAVEGRWFGHLKKSIDSFNKEFLKDLNGSIVFEASYMSLQCLSVCCSSPKYSINREEHDTTFNEVRAA